MSKRCARICLSCLLLVTLSGECFAQYEVCADQLSAGTPCCGQYECMVDQAFVLMMPIQMLRVQASPND